MSRKPDDAPVVWGDLRRVYKKLDDRISDAFLAVTELDNKQSEFWDEHEDKINRLKRALRRMETDLKALEEE